jgi:hypothetical protein
VHPRVALLDLCRGTGSDRRRRRDRVLDPGDFGPVTISKAISIYNNAVGEAGIAGSPGTNGIVVSAGANDIVDLRGLIFDGFNASSVSGLVFNSGARLNVQNCVFQGFATSGIMFSPGTGSATTTKIVVQDTTILNNGAEISIKPTGGIAANVALDRVRVGNNTDVGVMVDGTGGSGAINVVINDGAVSLNGGNGISAVSGPGNVTVSIMRVVVALNGLTGIQSNQSNGGTASVTVGSSVFFGNNTAVQSVGGGALLSYSNNQVAGNVTNGGFTGTASSQ